LEGSLSASAPSSSGSSTAKRRPPVFVITGTSGEGKSTLARLLLERVPELCLAVSATTRPQRPGEVEGRDYKFMTREEFDRRLADDEFLEWVEWPWGEHKRAGTLWSEVERITGRGRPVLLELETGGALAVRDRIPGSISFFITAPSEAELERRSSPTRSSTTTSTAQSPSSRGSSEKSWQRRAVETMTVRALGPGTDGRTGQARTAFLAAP